MEYIQDLTYFTEGKSEFQTMNCPKQYDFMYYMNYQLYPAGLLR